MSYFEKDTNTFSKLIREFCNMWLSRERFESTETPRYLM